MDAYNQLVADCFIVGSLGSSPLIRPRKFISACSHAVGDFNSEFGALISTIELCLTKRSLLAPPPQPLISKRGFTLYMEKGRASKETRRGSWV